MKIYKMLINGNRNGLKRSSLWRLANLFVVIISIPHEQYLENKYNAVYKDNFNVISSVLW